jgi:deazaflavin-dependent oxidoreductase (nitroreductase family)
MKSLANAFLAFHVFIYRLTKGKVMGAFGPNPLLLLDVVGRKTGKKRTTPVMYFRDGDHYFIAASNSGESKNPGWYYNLKSNPRTTVQIQGDVIPVVAEEASPDERQRLWAMLTERAPQFKQYETKTSRTIPVMILRPVK